MSSYSKQWRKWWKNIPQQGRAGWGGTWLLQEASLPLVELGLKLWVARWIQGHWESGEPTARALAVTRASEPLPDEPHPHQAPLLHHGQSPLLCLPQGARMLMTPPIFISYQNLPAAGFNFHYGRAERGGQSWLSKLLLKEEWSQGGQTVWNRYLAGCQVKLGNYSPKTPLRNLPNCECGQLQVV